MKNARVGKLPVGVLIAGVLALGYAAWGFEVILPGKAAAAAVHAAPTPVCTIATPTTPRCDS